MKRMLLGSVAALAMFLTTGTTAQSADIIPEPVAATDWSGFYVGAHLGYGWANFDGCNECGDVDTSELLAERLDLEGIVAGLHAGYNWQMDDIVFGLEADVTWTDMQDSTDAPEPDEDGQAGEVDLLASVRARLGIAMDDALIYVTGGLAISDAEWSKENTGSVEFDDLGGVVGGGVEYAVTETIRLRAEGLYYFFNDEQDVSDLAGNTGDEISFDDAIVVRGGVSFYFN